MPLPTEIDQYPGARPRIHRGHLREKPKFWPVNPSQVEQKWQWVWKDRPHLVLPLLEPERDTYKDYSGYGRHATAATAARNPAATFGETGLAYLFDESAVAGEGDYLIVPSFQFESNQATVTPSVSFAFRFRVPNNAGGTFKYFFALGQLSSANTINAYLWEQQNTLPGLLRCVVGFNGTGTATADVAAGGWDNGQWHSAVITIKQDGPQSRVTWYVDGIFRSTQTHNNDGFNPTAQLRIGANGTTTPDTGRFFGGYMDLFCIFRGAWTTNQASAWHADPFGFLRPKYGPLVGFRPADTTPDPPGEGQPTRARHRYLPHVGPRFGVH